jgi:UDPglucose 6-dehydrogenase
VLVQKALKRFKGNLKGKIIVLWGLSFKPNTDDMREAPSIAIVSALLKKGATVRAYDPVAMPSARNTFGTAIQYGKDNYSILKDADALMLLTEWNEFRRPNFERMLLLMRTPVIFDGRNIYSPRKLKEMGFEYHGIGC